jgi:hypothetical protein
MTANSSHRPKGVTIISFVLFWLFLSAIGNLFVSKSIQTANAFPPSSPAAKFATAVSSSSFTLLLTFYGVTALVAAVATWRMRPWMPIAFLVWCIAAVLLGVFFLSVTPTELILGGKPAATASVLGMAVVLWLLYRYVHRVALAASNAAL